MFQSHCRFSRRSAFLAGNGFWSRWPLRWRSGQPGRSIARRCETHGTARCRWTRWSRSRQHPRERLLRAHLEVAASVTTFLLAGRFFEARAQVTAGDAMRELAATGAKDACVLDTDGSERRVPVAELH